VTPPVPETVGRILQDGDFCHVAALTPAGPHVTPMVFTVTGDRVWVTTSRGSVKARAWRADPRVAGLVRAGERVVAFTGTATTYDLLDVDAWGRSLREGPLIALASVRFTRKNARFFAGYAVDAHHVPFAWTPPGRVFAELRIQRSAVLEEGRVVSVWGDWGTQVEGTSRFRAARTGVAPLTRLPYDVAGDLGASGEGALVLETPEGGPVVLPARWLADGGAVYAALHQEVLALAGGGPTAPAALLIDRPSWWRAREMVGAMVRGEGEFAVVGGLVSGGRSAAALAGRAGLGVEDAALVRVRPQRLVWWRGWSSGTAAVP